MNAELSLFNTIDPLGVVIAGVSIRQDADGRYCLNDLHKESGGEDRHRPTWWLQNQQTVELIAEIDSGKKERSPHGGVGIPTVIGVNVVNGGKSPGTYVVRELVYSYAMWISPSFNLRVIRTFDAVANKGQSGHSFPIPRSLPEALRLAADLEDQRVEQ